jgi:hypothetical protein
VILSIPYAFALGVTPFVALLLTALAALWASGATAVQLEPHCEAVPLPELTPRLAAKVAIDELVLGFEQWHTAGFALDGMLERVIGEIEEADAPFEREGLLEKPDRYHPEPPALVDPELRYETIGGHRVEMLRFESGYAPLEGEPGRARWLGYDACRDGWAWVLRHPGPDRPWLICTNGYRMGFARIDVSLFKRFYEACGLNVLMPVLPLHGPRRIGLQSGSGFLSIDMIDTLHAQAQAMWDMRRLLSWVEGQGAPAIGAFGISLGGYTTALFASLAEGLSCAIAGIPVTDFARLAERHGTAHQIRYAIHRGYDLERIARVLSVVSPLVHEPKVDHSGRLIFGAVADRLVTPDHVRDLWRHWDEPEIVWYQGSHCSFMTESDVWLAVDRTLRESGLVDDTQGRSARSVEQPAAAS